MIAEFWDCLRLDPEPVKVLRRHFEDHLRGGGSADLIVDLNGVEFAGSSSLGGFLGIQRISRQNSGRIVFCNVDPQVREVFRVSKLETLFLFATDLAVATSILGSSASTSSKAQATPSSESPPRETGSDSASSAARRSTTPPLRGRRRPN